MQSKELIKTQGAIWKFLSCSFVLVNFLLNQLLSFCTVLTLCWMSIIYTFLQTA